MKKLIGLIILIMCFSCTPPQGYPKAAPIEVDNTGRAKYKESIEMPGSIPDIHIIEIDSVEYVVVRQGTLVPLIKKNR
jgi:hypothetical protein